MADEPTAFCQTVLGTDCRNFGGPMTVEELAQRAMRPFRKQPAIILLIAILAFSLAVCLQYRAGAFQATCGQDACSHYISGAMIHDYLLAGKPSNPLSFLANYHEHYPLVGIGHWPPLYYGI